MELRGGKNRLVFETDLSKIVIIYSVESIRRLILKLLDLF